MISVPFSELPKLCDRDILAMVGVLTGDMVMAWGQQLKSRFTASK